jgi:type IV secretory pathway VirB2 component (pilin)
MDAYDPDPTTGSALTAAVDWLQAVLLGTAGTGIAILAIATVGLLMLSGRMPVRRGLLTVIGCFILFSAETIADGIIGSYGSTGADHVQAVPVAPAPDYTPGLSKPAPYDPYAGASVPTQRTEPQTIR